MGSLRARVHPLRDYFRLGLIALVPLLFATPLSSQLNAAQQIRFLAIGDAPYSEGEFLLLESLLEQELEKGTPFIVHVGDVKGGTAPCTDRGLERIADLFRSWDVPVVYTPGDNEWTDCRRSRAGGYDPHERLALLRRLVYADPDALRLGSLDVRQPDAAYPENYFFFHKGVLFVTVHVVGSFNNLAPGDVAARAEHESRSRANRRNLGEALKAAKEEGAQSLVLVFHADPALEQPTATRGFGPIREDLSRLLRDYPGPILAIHGDSHVYRFDHPLTNPDTGEAETRFARLIVPGSPTVAGVWVSVEPTAPEPFAVELVYPADHAIFLEE